MTFTLGGYVIGWGGHLGSSSRSGAPANGIFGATTPYFFVMTFVISLGGVFFRFVRARS